MNILKAIGKPFTALAGKVDSTVENKILMSVIRHGATAVGAALVTHGYLAMSDATEFAGALVTLIATLSAGQQKVNEAK